MNTIYSSTSRKLATLSCTSRNASAFVLVTVVRRFTGSKVIGSSISVGLELMGAIIPFGVSGGEVRSYEALLHNTVAMALRKFRFFQA